MRNFSRIEYTNEFAFTIGVVQPIAHFFPARSNISQHSPQYNDSHVEHSTGALTTSRHTQHWSEFIIAVNSPWFSIWSSGIPLLSKRAIFYIGLNIRE
jgi:hypothetical protein